MIQHRIERRKTKLRIVVECELDEALGTDPQTYRPRFDLYLRHVANDLMDVLDILKAEGELGTVKWFDEQRGYGFIRVRESDDVFVHWKGISGDAEYKILEKDQRVRFKRRQGRESIEAYDVEPVNDGPEE